DFAADNNLWIAVVTGAGEKAFSAGNDLKFTAENSMKGMKPARGGFAGITRRFDINKPLIAAVNGFALGGGFEIALAGLKMPLEQAVEEKFPGLYKLLHSHDVVEGPRAFAQKRKPQWKLE